MMRPGSIALATLLAAIAISPSADAQPPQGVIMVRDLSLALATQIAQGALDHCRAKNFKIGVSVVDRGGHVLISMRDDGTAHHVVELAERKAYTARIFRQTTGQFVDRIINNPRSQGLKDTKGVLASLGGDMGRRRPAGKPFLRRDSAYLVGPGDASEKSAACRG